MSAGHKGCSPRAHGRGEVQRKRGEETDTGYDFTHARQLDPDDLAAMRTRGRPTPDTTEGQSRAVSVR
jgi:hypothetical protein